MPVTMEDIARAAGVARSTVSRALANSHRVNLQTRLNIQRIAREMGYLPNAVARGLTTKRTYNLGVLILDITEAYVGELVREMDRAARENGYGLILAHCGYEFEQIRDSVNMLVQRRVDAIIVADRVITDIYEPFLQGREQPFLVINMREHPYSVSIDNTGSAKRAVDFLLELGHGRIAYIGSPRAKVESKEREDGYRQALSERGVLPEPDLIVIPDSWAAAEAGRQGMERLLKTCSPAPTAVFCFNDLTAIGAMAEIASHGLHVPGEISVIGFDNNKLAPFTVPALTTMAQPKERMAELAVKNVLGMLDGKPIEGSEPFACELIVRDSTAPPRGPI